MVKKLILLGLFLLSVAAYSKEYVEESEKDFPLRSVGLLQISNMKGDIAVQGWALDKIRVRIVKRVMADTEGEASTVLKKVDYRLDTSGKNIELASQYGGHLTIEERLQEKEHPRVKMDFFILAPSRLRLRIWSADGKISLKGWNASAEVRSNSGPLLLDGVNGEMVSVLCDLCTAQVKNISGSLRCVGGVGSFELRHISGKKIYAETASGPLKLWHIHGNQLYLSKTGSIEGQFLSGAVEFRVKKSGVTFRQVKGFLSGSLEEGDLTAQIREWEWHDKSLIEVGKGNIYLSLPRTFTGEVDLSSKQGKISSDFIIQNADSTPLVAPIQQEQPNHWVGRIGEGGDLLKASTQMGSIELTHL